MTNYLKTLLNMFKSVYGFTLNEKQIETTQTVQAWYEGMLDLKLRCEKIDGLITAHAEELKGYTSQKKKLKEIACLAVYSIIKPATAFAMNTKNEILLAQVNRSMTALRTTPDSVFSQVMADLISAVSEYSNVLGSYSVTPEMINSATEAVSDFEKYHSVPRCKVAQRKALTKNINDTILDTNNFIRFVLDPLAVAFMENNLYYNSYFAMRKHVPVHNGTTKARVLVLDDISGNPLPLATVSVDETDLKELTNIDGKCAINTVPHGIRKIKVTCGKYQNYISDNISVIQGRYIDITVRLTPVFNIQPAPTNNKEEMHTANSA